MGMYVHGRARLRATARGACGAAPNPTPGRAGERWQEQCPPCPQSTPHPPRPRVNPRPPARVAPRSKRTAQEISRHQAAAELHEGIDDAQGAIRAYCAGRLWDKARALGGTNPTFSRYIEDQYNNFLLANQQADELATRGGAHAQQAIDMYVARDDWAKVHQLAAAQGPEVAAAYAVRQADRCFKQGNYAAAAEVFATNGIPGQPQYFELYRNIALGVLTANSAERSAPAEKSLRDMMYRLVNVLRSTGTATKYKQVGRACVCGGEVGGRVCVYKGGGGAGWWRALLSGEGPHVASNNVHSPPLDPAAAPACTLPPPSCRRLTPSRTTTWPRTT